MEQIPRGEMVIEYVGEVIRVQVADKREGGSGFRAIMCSGSLVIE